MMRKIYLSLKRTRRIWTRTTARDRPKDWSDDSKDQDALSRTT